MRHDLPSQSTLDTAGLGAEKIAQLFYWMSGGATLIWIVVIGLVIYALKSRREHPRRLTSWLVIGGGAAMPTIVLTGLLAYGLALLPDLQRPAPVGSLTIEVAGVRWWWRVQYNIGDSGQRISTANEIHLPVNRPVEFKLTSEDVIHSFWIPSIGGKVDMVPGRTNRLTLHPTREGVFSGVCAEYCGTAHAQMRFRVVVTNQAAFEEWLRNESQDCRKELTSSADSPFFTRGCSACHTIRGTAANGVVGPDLTHFGSRLAIAAGVLDNTTANLTRWLADTHGVKPGVEMPEFESLSDDEIESLVSFLEALQ